MIGKSEAEKKEQFMNHMKTPKIWLGDMKGKTNTQIFNEYKSVPVCPRCNKLACRHTGYRTSGNSKCDNCGWEGKTMTMDEVITQQLYK